MCGFTVTVSDDSTANFDIEAHLLIVTELHPPIFAVHHAVHPINTLILNMRWIRGLNPNPLDASYAK